MIIPARSTTDITANREEWAAALESGVYTQGIWRLRSGDARCCLGVACDVAGYTWIEGADEDGDFYAHLPACDGYMSAEETTIEGTLLADALGLTSAQIETLIKWNDSDGYPFAEIASRVRDLPIDARFVVLEAAAG